MRVCVHFLAQADVYVCMCVRLCAFFTHNFFFYFRHYCPCRFGYCKIFVVVVLALYNGTKETLVLSLSPIRIHMGLEGRGGAGG